MINSYKIEYTYFFMEKTLFLIPKMKMNLIKNVE